METTKGERAESLRLLEAVPNLGYQVAGDFTARLIRDVDTLEEALEERDKTVGLCQSFASNTSGGMDAEARLRRIYELCCRARAV